VIILAGRIIHHRIIDITVGVTMAVRLDAFLDEVDAKPLSPNVHQYSK